VVQIGTTQHHQYFCGKNFQSPAKRLTLKVLGKAFGHLTNTLSASQMGQRKDDDA